MSSVTFTGKRRVRRVQMRNPGRDDVAVERGLDQLALDAPRFTLARHETVSEQDGDAIDADALGEVGVAVDENVAHVVRVRKHPDVALQCGREHAKRIAVEGEIALQHGKRIRLERDVERPGSNGRFEMGRRGLIHGSRIAGGRCCRLRFACQATPPSGGSRIRSKDIPAFAGARNRLAWPL
jgi:hypothetical protein